MNSSKLKRLMYIALMGTMAYLLARFTKFSPFAAAPFLKMDFGEVPLILASVAISPGAGLTALLIKEMLSLLISGSNIFGLIADYAVVGCFLTVFTRVLNNRPLPVPIALSTLAGSVVRMIVSIPINIIVLRLQFGTNIYGVIAQLPYILPFNLLKCILGGVCFLYLYPRVKPVFALDTPPPYAHKKGDAQEV